MLKPLDENFRHLPITSITFTSDDASSSSIPAPGVPDLTASPSASTVLLNGQSIVFDAYTINGNNYFKLRDLAYALSGTNKQFDVSWDGEANAIALTSGQPYTPVGGELASKGSQIQTPVPSLAKVYLDGAEVALTAYTIQGNNYFKLRDVAALLNGTPKQFDVGYDEASNSTTITTGEGYAKQDTDLQGKPTAGGTATVSGDSVIINGKKAELTVYKINGSNYFKLRDLGKALNFYVGWSAERGIYIETSKPYSE